MIAKVLSGLLVVVAGLFVWVTCFTNHVYVTTPSMYPTIPPGSMVFIQREPDYHVGNVIEFRGAGLHYMHRIIKINAAGDITTKGDNPENSPDIFIPPTTERDVIGKAVLAVPWLGFPELIAHHPLYGLSWLRAELGFAGRVVVIVVGGLLAWMLCSPARRLKPRPTVGLRQ